MCKWLAEKCEAMGIEIYPGFAAAEVLWDGDRVTGVRTGDMGLDADGNPMADATVEFRQISHDFLFGIAGSLHMAPPGGYELMREAGVNFATLMFYWDWTEHEQDAIVWDWIDHGIGVLDLHDMGFELKAHAIQSLWPWGNPEYLKEMALDFRALDVKTDEHISALVSRYREQIDTWNVINEAHFRGGALDLDRECPAALRECPTLHPSPPDRPGVGPARP